ncbi:uncharacterized protein LOC123677474 isoform X2 [Harmonia axyridis]|nr:uncharacterized protein LOC123677474 isoform X2 [Harmonia axyridis]
MPKLKKPLESTRTSSRRQASKEALKQLQLLLDDEDDDAFVIPEEEDKKDIRLEPTPKKRVVSPIIDSPPPKKKYKLSHRKSSDGNDRDVIVLKSISNSNYVPNENTLELECFVEELSDVQKEMQKKAELEERELQAKLDELIKSKKAEVVYQGEMSSAIEVNELISACGKKSVFKPSEIPQLNELGEQSAPTIQLVMDPRTGIIVGSMHSTNQVQISTPPIAKNKLQISSAVKAVASLPQNTPTPAPRNMRSRRGGISTPPALVQSRTNTSTLTRSNSHGVITRGNSNTTRSNNSVRGLPQSGASSPTIQTRGMKSIPTIQTRNNKATPPTTSKRPIINVPVEKQKQVVDLTSEENRNQADNREIAFSKLQGKTYPSLVVVARPHLRVTDLSIDRPKLDAKVKSVLMHPPTKFTEWLIQQGLIRAEQKCPVHSNTQLKLGMYSDVAKFPFSGGYVWISECCPQRFVSVFNGSIFEGSPHPPVVMLKLIYHWACQTNIQNVTQWVKVDNLYVKGVYVWLRGICTVAVQSRLRQLGGPGCRIEVGVISLGTTSHDGNQRQVKVEVLGVLESSTKYLRLRAVEPMPDGDRNFRKKFLKILEPILSWVHPASTIVTDLTVDKATLHHMGFTNVIQTTSNDYSQSNRTIMEFLRRIVPRMFQNTLSLLSRQIIQQFLDELVWREWFGITSQLAFDNILAHLAEQTRSNTHTPLVLRLNKVAANPFRCWSNNAGSPIPGNSATPTPAPRASKISEEASSTSKNPPQASAAAAATPAKTPVPEVKKYGRGKKNNAPQVQVVQERPNKPVSPDVPEQMVPLENYYYGTIDPLITSSSKVTLNMKCPFCKSSFDNNILLQNHLFKHAHNVSNDAYLCRYCLTSVSTANELIHHVNKCHPGETKFDYGFVCLICEIHYMNPFVLGKHMSKEHIPHELPYQCGSCSFRCSNHKQVIDHFYLKHDGGATIQCPFCLKSTTVWSSGRNVAQNIHYFIQHLQKHQKKQFAKRCGKCNLWFVQKEVLKEHQQKMHISLRGKAGLVPYASPRNGVMVPKSKIDKDPCDAEVINFSSLYYNVSSDSVCKECNQTISSSKHFPSFDNCQNPNCQYSTCCAIAMMTHNAKCKGLNSVIPPETLPYEMFCVCGFRDVDGNSMAKHLAICEKKSAYPSEAEAKSATVMHSMLDILGLVRKPEEKPSETIPIEEKTEDSLKTTKKAIDSTEINILSDEEDESPVSVEILEKNKPNENDSTLESTIKEENTAIIDKQNSNIDDKVIENKKESEEDTIIDIESDEDIVINDEVITKSPQDIPKKEEKQNLEVLDDDNENETEEIKIDLNKEQKENEFEINEIPEVSNSPSEKGTTDHDIEKDLMTEKEENEVKSTEVETEKKIEADITEQKMETDQTEKSIDSDEIETDQTEKNLDSDEIENEQIEKENEGNLNEKEIETENSSQIEQIEGEVESDKIEKEIDDTNMNIEIHHTEKEMPTENTAMEVDHDEKEMEVDHDDKEMELDHDDKEMEVDHDEKEMEIDQDKKEMEIDHNEKEIKIDQKEIRTEETQKDNEIENTVKGIEENDMEGNIDTVETEKSECQSPKNLEGEVEENLTKEKIGTNHPEEQINNVEFESDSAKLAANEEENLESLVTLDEVPMEKNKNDEKVDLEETNNENDNKKDNEITEISGDSSENATENDQQLNDEKDGDIQEQEVVTQQNESNTVSDPNSCQEKSPVFDEVIDDKTLVGTPCKDSENENVQEDNLINDVLATDNVPTTNLNLTEGSASMDVD